MMRSKTILSILAVGLICCATVHAQQPDPLLDDVAELTHFASYYGGDPNYQVSNRLTAYATEGEPTCAAPASDGHANACGCNECRFRIASWGSLDYLLWWTRGRPTPALVTTSPVGTARTVAGEVPGAAVLFGDGPIGEGIGAGGLLDVGAWVDEGNQMGFGARFIGYSHDTSGFFASSTGDPILARPFFDIGAGGPDASLVAFRNPALVDENEGFVSVDANLAIYVAEPYMRLLLDHGPGYRVDLMAGYHMTRINDGVRIDSQTTIVDPLNVFFGTRFNVTDDFHATNEFHGGSLGLITEVERGCWNFRAMTKISLGTMSQRVRIGGLTTITPPVGAAATSTGGLLALGSNSGSFSRDRTALVPEANFSVGYRFRENMTLSVGYSFTYWNRMVFAGDQIDTTIDPLQVISRPQFLFKETDFWAQGLNLGFTWEFN